MSVRYPKVDRELPPVEKLNMSDVCEYLNKVLEKYGPPCDWCKNFNSVSCKCEKSHRILKYNLDAGPYETWYIRKYCDDHEGIDMSNGEEETRRHVDVALSCGIQTYCRRS